MALLEVRSITKEFYGLKALDKVDLSLAEGRILGIIGPNGAGKTTLFNVISGLLRPTEGEIYFRGRPINELKPHEISMKGIARTFQIVRPFSNFTVIKNVLAAIGHRSYSGLLSSIALYQKEDHVREACGILARVGMEDYQESVSKTLPLGLKKQLEIARALALEPSLLLLDEPTAGLRYEESERIISLVRKLQGEGITIVLIEHNMQVVMGLCEQIVVLDHGVKIAEGTPDEIKTNPQVIEAYLGREENAA